MAVGILNASLAQPVGLIRDGKHHSRSRIECTLSRPIGLVDDKAQPHRGAAQRLGAQVEAWRVLIDNEERLALDGHLRDDLSRWCFRARNLGRAKSFLVELHSFRPVPDGQHWCERRLGHGAEYAALERSTSSLAVPI